MDEMETRPVALMEVREQGGRQVIAGYAAVFNSPTNLGQGINEVVLPGAFADSLSNDGDVRALWNHDSSLVLGRTTAGTLRVFEDAVGLAFEVTPPETTWATDALVSVKRGDVNQMSFGFTVPGGGDEWAGNTRMLKRVNLMEVSVVAFPAYPQTSATVQQRAAELRAQSERPDDSGDRRTQERERLRRIFETELLR